MKITFLCLVAGFFVLFVTANAAEDPMADLISRTYHISVKSDYVFASTSVGLTIYRLKGDKAEHISTLPLPNGGASSLLDGDILYVFAGNSGIYKAGIKNPSKPETLDLIKPEGSAINGDLNRDKIFVSMGSTGFVIIDRSGFKLLEQIETPSYCALVKLVGDRLFVSTELDGVLIYDVTKKKGKIVANIPAKKRVRDMVVSGDYLFLANDTDGILVLKRDKLRYEKLHNYDTPDTARGLAIYKDYLFVADGNTGILVYKIEKDGRLTFKMSRKTDYSANKVFIKDNIALISNDALGIMILNIEDLIK